MKILPEGVKLFHADAQTDRQTDEANIHFSQVLEGSYKQEIVKGHFLGNEKPSIYYGVTMNSFKKMTGCVPDTKR